MTELPSSFSLLTNYATKSLTVTIATTMVPFSVKGKPLTVRGEMRGVPNGLDDSLV